MPRKPSYHNLDKLMLFSLKRRGFVYPKDEATAAPVIKYMDFLLDPEVLSQDGERSPKEQQEVMDMVLRAKGDLETILGRRVTLSNQE